MSLKPKKLKPRQKITERDARKSMKFAINLKNSGKLKDKLKLMKNPHKKSNRQYKKKFKNLKKYLNKQDSYTNLKTTSVIINWTTKTSEDIKLK